MNIEDEEGPGTFTHCSKVYVWHGDGMSVGLHLLPKDVPSKDANVETIVNITHGTLMDLKHIPPDNVLVVLHHLPIEKRVNVTLLPVGSESNVEKAKNAFEKDDELFRTCLNDVVDKSTSEPCVSVSVLYNSPSDFTSSASGDLAIVHELDVIANPTEFLQDVKPSLT